MRCRAAIPAILVGAVTLGGAKPARAEDGPEGMGFIIHTMRTLELVIPDIRLELRPDRSEHRTAAVLTWPIVIKPLIYRQFGPFESGLSGQVRRWFFNVQPVFEVHWDPSTDARRLLLAARTNVGRFWSNRDFTIETGGLLGEDGSGAYVGAGVYWVVESRGPGIAYGFLSRVTYTPDEIRYDIAFDFVWPFFAEL